MSTYVSCRGEIRYSNQADFDEVVRLLHDNHYIKYDYFVDEMGERIFDCPVPDISQVDLAIAIPIGHYRNLGYIFNQILAKGNGEIVWATSDGQYQGGVMENDGNGITERLVDLVKWGNKYMEGVAPNEETEPEDFCQWMNDAEIEFVGDPDVEEEDVEELILPGDCKRAIDPVLFSGECQERVISTSVKEVDFKSNFPELMLKDRQVHWSSNKQEAFLSLQNGIISLKPDGTWEWSERPE